jgi:guanine deaminase
MRTGLATDIGGGTSYSMFATMAEGYKVQQLLGFSLHPGQMLYLTTLGGANSLCLDDRIGNFAIGKEADLVVLTPHQSPVLARRASLPGRTELDLVFACMMLGNERAVAATYVMGQRWPGAPA